MDALESAPPPVSIENKSSILNQEVQKPPRRYKMVKPKSEPLTTKKAVELLLAGNLRKKVCRFCLQVTQPLSELDQILSIAGKNATYDVTIRDIVASFYPFKILDDENLPNKICNECLNQSLKSYVFTQQCEQSERALRNCFDDIYEKFEKLDPIEPKLKKRGRHKIKVNHNILHTEHRSVIDYAEPIINIINTGSKSYTKEPMMGELECRKCWQVLPTVESLANHEKSHPKTMWYNCRLCGQSVQKLYLFKRHLKKHLRRTKLEKEVKDRFECKQCGAVNEDYMNHLQHLEKHKFQKVLECLLEKKMDNLCAVCLEVGRLTDLDKTMSFHGGYPELSGDRSLVTIIGTSVPEMNILHNYTGTKICEKCLENSIRAYVFISRIRYVHSRLDICITRMIENLNNEINTDNKLFIEISGNGILPILDYEETDQLLLEEHEVDEKQLKVDVLEDEFREPDSESDSTDFDDVGTKRDTKLKLLNGYQTYSKVKDVCSEFLTFKKKIKRNRGLKSKFICPVCDKCFISDYFLKKHVLKHKNQKIECKICKNKFKSKFFMGEHLKMNHESDKSDSNQCLECGRVFAKIFKFKQHNSKCHRNKKCQLCSKVFANQTFFDSHMQRHAFKFKLYKRNSVKSCSFCEDEFLNENELLVHVNKVHLQIRPHQCDMCDRKFYTERNLSQHKRVHSIQKRQTCKICSKILKSRQSLVVHIRKHLGIKPNKCLVCSECFYSEYQVRKHMRSWHGGCNCCKLCRKVFLNKSGLKVHINTAHSVF